MITDADFEARVDKGFRWWVAKVASERLPAHRADDAAQEALAAVWRVLCERPDAPKSYLVGTVKRSIAGSCRGDRVTAGTGRSGYVDAYKHAVLAVDDTEMELPDSTAEAAFEMIERNEAITAVNAALTELTDRDREIVRMRFWEERPWRVIAEHFGYATPRTAESHFRLVIRPLLREALAA